MQILHKIVRKSVCSQHFSEQFSVNRMVKVPILDFEVCGFGWEGN